MFKSTLGLGLGSTKKADLTAYLKNLEKKNKEVQRKHSVTGTEEGDAAAAEVEEEKGESSQEDSDLLSLAREMQEEQYESPFIKRRKSAAEEASEAAAAASAGVTGDGRVPEESEVSCESPFHKNIAYLEGPFHFVSGPTSALCRGWCAQVFHEVRQEVGRGRQAGRVQAGETVADCPAMSFVFVYK